MTSGAWVQMFAKSQKSLLDALAGFELPGKIALVVVLVKEVLLARDEPQGIEVEPKLVRRSLIVLDRSALDTATSGVLVDDDHALGAELRRLVAVVTRPAEVIAIRVVAVDVAPRLRGRQANVDVV